MAQINTLSLIKITILLVTFSYIFYPANGQGLGDNDCTAGAAQQDTFECTNTSAGSIDCSMVNDGFNDCGDNSDEGYLYDCRYVDIGNGDEPQFKCTREDLADYSNPACTVLSYDGQADCSDRSDEQKYLGDACLGEEEDLESDIGCWYFIENVFCNSSNQCECQSGAMSIRRGSNCQIRVRTDPCDTEADCNDAYYGLTCNASSLCDCKIGFYVDETDNTNCIGNKLYENCTIDLECSNPVPNAECDPDFNICVCNDLYIADHTTNSSCPTRVLGDPCSYGAQCRTGMDHATCVAGECVCKDGAFANDDGDDCIKNLVGDACADDSECALIRYGECSGGTCDCADSDYLVDYLNLHCSLGLGDLYCDSDDNCTSEISNSICENNVCMCEYGRYADERTKCSQRIIGSRECRNDTDCKEAIKHSICREGACQCDSGYAPDISNTKGKKCIPADEAGCDDFACQYPWAIVILVIGILGIIALVIFLVIKKPWRKPGESGGEKKPRKVEPVGNGAIDAEKAKPVWSLRPKSGIPAMYGNDVRMQEATDPETEAFYKGGLTSVETTDEARLTSAERKVRFEPVPSTPGNIDLEMPDSAHKPNEDTIDEDMRITDMSPRGSLIDDIPDEAVEDGATAGSTAILVNEVEGGQEDADDEPLADDGKKKKKGKKGKKEKKEKKKKKSKNKNNNAKSREGGELTLEDEEFMNDDLDGKSPPATVAPTHPRRLSTIQRQATMDKPLTPDKINQMLIERQQEGEQVSRIREMEREKSEVQLVEKLAMRKNRLQTGIVEEEEL